MSLAYLALPSPHFFVVYVPFSVLYRLAYTADDDSWTYVEETFSSENYCDFSFPF